MIEELIEKFDFEKVHAYMESVGWKWYGGAKEAKVPSIEEMKDMVRYLYRQMLLNPARETADFITSSGGFCITQMNGHLHLSFNLCDINIRLSEN